MQDIEGEIERLQAAIIALEGQRQVLGDEIVDTSQGALREKLVALETAARPEQRKLATILFADIVGSTRLSQQIGDPEKVLEVMDGALRRLAVPVAAEGGRVLRFMGDGFLAAFGLPQAHEDDAERAVRAGLAILQAANQYAAAIAETHGVAGFAVRVGVNTGHIASGGFSEAANTIMGLDVNLAARLESAAPPGGLLISHFTYRQVRGLFDVTPLEPIVVKGFPEPVKVYLVRQIKPRAFRMVTRGVEGVETRMIGREAEFDRLKAAYTLLLSEGGTQVVTIIGEAGVGKSRLVYEFENWVEVRPERVYYFKGRATANRRSVALGLFRDLFVFRFGILESDTAAVALDKFRAGIMTARGPYSEQLSEAQADIIGHWLGFDFSDSPSVANLLGSPQFGATARVYLVAYFRALAQSQPTVIFLEDIHWADARSLELVRLLASALGEPAGRQVSLLLVCLARPALYEEVPDWDANMPRFQRIDLSPLDPADNRDLVDEILRHVEDVPEALRELIANRAEGNPYYTEELVHMLVDQRVILPGDGLWRVDLEQLNNVRVPATLTNLLQARVDGLPRSERQVLKQASIVGRIFWDAAAAAVAQMERSALVASLNSVAARELIYRRGLSVFAEAQEFIFKHALLHDVVYESVLMRLRKQYHRRAAEWLEANAGERISEYLAVIAGHYELAGLYQQAAGYLERSGDFASNTNAYATASQAYERALKLLGANAANPDENRARLGYKTGVAHLDLGELETAKTWLAMAITAAAEQDDGRLSAQAQIGYARSLALSGDYSQARGLAQQALAIAEHIGGETLFRGMMVLQLLDWTEGDLAAAEVTLLRMLALARELGNARFEIMALNRLGHIAFDRPDLDAAQDYYQSALQLVEQYGNPVDELIVNNSLGTLAMKRDDVVGARGYFSIALALARQLDRRLNIALILGNLAETSLDLGEPQTARQQLLEAMTVATRAGGDSVLIANLFAYARLLAAEGDVTGALALFGLVRHHPAGHHQFEGQIESEIGQLQLPEEEVASLVASGATLQLVEVVQEILSGG
jgi:class 3 adenylate cyclase/tetratricopeptide (TPR) repeat protein